MGYYVPWSAITSIWKSASQIWSQAWYEGEPPTPPAGVDDSKYSGALDPSKTTWWNWVENQKRIKKKRKIELACIISGIEFKQEKDSSEEVEIGFKVNNINFSLNENQLSEVHVRVKS